MSVSSQAISTSASLGLDLGRRTFLPGVTLLTAGLAAGVMKFGPKWDDSAPARAVRSVSAAVPTVVVSAPPPPVPSVVIHSAKFRQDWLAFRHLYVTPEGRVVDTGNGNISHSEGQGWGLMAAQAADDKETFARVLDWTTHNLQRRPYDRLHAWRYKPSDANPVSDLNNATDGDIYIAAALARAAARWNRPDYAEQAAHIARDILGLVRTAGARSVFAARRRRVRAGRQLYREPILLRLRSVQRPRGPRTVPQMGGSAPGRDGARVAGAIRQIHAAAGLGERGPAEWGAIDRNRLAAAVLVGRNPRPVARGLGRDCRHAAD